MLGSRLALRLFVLTRGKSDLHASILRRNSQAFVTAHNLLVAEYRDAVGDDSDPPFLRFLDWLLANADEILALIAKIVEMFS